LRDGAGQAARQRGQVLGGLARASARRRDDVVGDDPSILALVTVKNDDAGDQPGWDDLYEVGTAAIVDKMLKAPDGTLRVLVRGLERIRVTRRLQDDPYFAAEIEELPDVLAESDEVEALTRQVQSMFQRTIELLPYLPDELAIAAANVDDPGALCNLIASLLRLKTDEKQRLLELADVEARLREVLRILNRELELLELLLIGLGGFVAHQGSRVYPAVARARSPVSRAKTAGGGPGRGCRGPRRASPAERLWLVASVLIRPALPHPLWARPGRRTD